MTKRTDGPTTRRPALLSSVVSTYSTNVVVSVISLANVLVTARALGPDGRGSLVLLTTIAMITSQLSSLGVEESVANLGGTQPHLRSSIATTSSLISIVFGGAAAAVIALLIVAFPSVGGGSKPALLALVLASIPLLLLQFYFQFLIRADYGFAVTNAVWILGPIVNLGVNGLLAALGTLTVTTAISTWIAGQLLGTAVLAWYLSRRLAGFGRPDWQLAQRMVGFGVQAHLGRVMKTGNYRLDQWLLGAIGGSRELGLYSVAVAWTEALFFLPDALVLVLRPDLVRAEAREAGRQGAIVFRLAIILTAPLVIAFVIAAPILCVTAFGSEFRGAIDDLRILAPGAFGMVALKLFSNALIAQRRPLLSNAAIAVAFAVTIALDILLIPGHGGTGAAVASTVAYTVGGAAVAIIFVRALGRRVSELLPRRSDIRFVTRLRSHIS